MSRAKQKLEASVEGLARSIAAGQLDAFALTALRVHQASQGVPPPSPAVAEILALFRKPAPKPVGKVKKR